MVYSIKKIEIMRLTTTSSTERVTLKENNLIKLFLVAFFVFWAYTLFFTADLANWMIENIFTRIVHYSYGFLLGYPLRDYFKNWFDWPNWVCWVLPVEITMSLSGAYEIIEWLVADVFFKAQGTAYLGTQGDVWDSQKDMALALIGAVLVMLIAAYSKKLLRK